MGVLSSSGATVAITVLSSLLLATSLSLLQERQITADLTATLSSSSSSSSPPYVMEREKSVEGIDPLSKFKGKDANATMIQHQQRQQQRPPLKTCLDPNGPQPYILLTLGRSGSGSTWQAIGTLTGLETPSIELPGSSSKEQTQYFQKHEGDNGHWMLRYLCTMQKKYPNAGVVGFKWKPQEPSLHFNSSLAALHLVAQSNHPPIKVVRSKRNPLDVWISQAKHHNNKSPAHCLEEDKNCLKKALRASLAVTLDTIGLHDKLKEMIDREERMDQLLRDWNISHVQVTYERLYYSSDRTEEWSKILAYLGDDDNQNRNFPTNLTTLQLDEAIHHVPTHAAPTQKVTLQNFAEVASELQGTDLEYLLHR